jgi:hypothetical protein
MLGELLQHELGIAIEIEIGQLHIVVVFAERRFSQQLSTCSYPLSKGSMYAEFEIAGIAHNLLYTPALCRSRLPL